ncbi:MAG: HNH endonuclease signature motif containing protein, partial [Burkholderiaceae bacterium]
PSNTKKLLREEAGGKCANPGCGNTRVHFHHIKEWAVYKSHDLQHMIAICPVCHDAVHNGVLEISDETLYQWKAERSRALGLTTIPLYVEPSPDVRLELGSWSFKTENTLLSLFELSKDNLLGIRLLEPDDLRISARISDASGREVLRVVENLVRVQVDQKVKIESRPGHIRLTVPATEDYYPQWLLVHLLQMNSLYARTLRITSLELEVLRAGVVKVSGCWCERGYAIVSTPTAVLVFTGTGPPMVLGAFGPVEDGPVTILGGEFRVSMFGMFINNVIQPWNEDGSRREQLR